MHYICIKEVDRALLGAMGYTFARVSAVVTLRMEDYFQQGRRSWMRLHEKGGKRHEVACHHSLDEYLDAWIEAATIGDDKKGPLFRSFKKGNKLTSNPLTRTDVLHMIKRRAQAAGLPYSTYCHSFRATGITAYLQNGGTLEHAQQIAAHQSPRTTKLYDRTKDEISLDEVEKINFSKRNTLGILSYGRSATLLNIPPLGEKKSWHRTNAE